MNKPFPSNNEEALEAIRKVGGIVQPVGSGWEIQFQLGREKVGDDELGAVAVLEELVISLNLRDTAITNEGLKHLASLTNLKRLHLERTSVGDPGMTHLKKLHDLEYLNLYGTKVSDVGLAELGRLNNLEKLFVWQTAVTDDGCKTLSRSLPQLRIVRGVDLDKVAAKAAAKKEVVTEAVRVDLEWITGGLDEAPKSKTGDFTTVLIKNRRNETVKLYWVEYGGGLRYYAEIAAGESLLRNTFSNATWVIKSEEEIALGYFIVPSEPSQIEIPKI